MNGKTTLYAYNQAFSYTINFGGFIRLEKSHLFTINWKRVAATKAKSKIASRVELDTAARAFLDRFCRLDGYFVAKDN